jgi:hypothetical protein
LVARSLVDRDWFLAGRPTAISILFVFAGRYSITPFPLRNV